MAADTPEITQPVRIDEDRLIQNVYANIEGQPDDGSQDEFSQYLVDRMYGVEGEVAQKYKPGDEQPHAKWTREGWFLGLSPRNALIATGAALLVANVAVNAKSIVGKIGETADDVANMIGPKMRSVPGKTQRQKTITEVRNFDIDTSGREQPSGVAEHDSLSARQFARKLKAISKDGRITKIVIDGNASDEWTANGIKSVGRHDEQNRQLSLERAKNFSQSVTHETQKEGVKLPTIQTTSHEHVLGHEQLGEFLADVQESQYDSVLAAITAYNHRDPAMSPSLRSEIRNLIGSQRVSTAAVTIKETIDLPGKTVVTPSHEEEVPRKDKKHPLTLIPILIPPIPRFRRREQDPFLRPPTITEEPIDKVWLELYEQALKPNGEVVDNAWSLTRKYQALYREERITQALRYDYKAADGKRRGINVLFIDRPELDEATIEAITNLMFDITLLQAGNVAEGLDTIAVLPAEHTGAQRPDRIGLGIDEQYHENILGVAIPLIGLVELQLPKKPSASDIQRFNGLRWVLAHEVAGHFTDVNKQGRFIDKAKSNRPGRTFTSRNPWTTAGNDGYASTARRGSLQVRQFAISNPDGQPTEYVVNPGDPALAKAESIRLRGEAPTNYGDSEPGELHAETAAAVMTSITIPAEEAGIHPRALRGRDYRVDAGLQHRFVSHVGARQNTEILEWDPETEAEHAKRFKVSVLDGEIGLHANADLHADSEGAKNQPYQADEKRLKILARARR